MRPSLQLLLLAALAACAREVEISLAPDASCAGRALGCLSYVQLVQVEPDGTASSHCASVTPAPRRAFDQLGLKGAVSMSQHGSASSLQVLGFGPSPAGPCTGPLLFAAGASSGTTVLPAACHIDCSQSGPGASGAVATFLNDPIDGAPQVDSGELFQAQALVPTANPEVRFTPFTQQALLDPSAAFAFSGPFLLVPPSTGAWCLAVRVRRDGVPPSLTCIDQGLAATAFTVGREDVASLNTRLSASAGFVVGQGFIVGRVLDADIGVPIAGAQVSPLTGGQAVAYFAGTGLSSDPNPVTDSSGLFAVLTADVLHLRATAPGYTARTSVAGAQQASNGQPGSIGLVQIALHH